MGALGEHFGEALVGIIIGLFSLFGSWITKKSIEKRADAAAERAASAAASAAVKAEEAVNSAAQAAKKVTDPLLREIVGHDGKGDDPSRMGIRELLNRNADLTKSLSHQFGNLENRMESLEAMVSTDIQSRLVKLESYMLGNAPAIKPPAAKKVK